MSIPSRVGSASSKRVTQSELWTLRDTVLQLQEDLLLSRAQLNKAVNQFDSLVELVRKSWKGDVNASVQVARLVGVPPPENQRHRLKRMNHPQVSPTDVSRADDGFLNSDSINDEGTQDERNNEYLNGYLKERQKYLEEQLALHDKQVNLATNAKTSDSSLATSKQPIRSLYRQMSATKVSSPGAVESAKYSADPHGSCGSNNSLRYTQFGLFDVDRVVESTNSQKTASRNAHSAVLRKTERPMKYESVRPVSADLAGVKGTRELHVGSHRLQSSNTVSVRSRSAKTGARGCVSDAPQVGLQDEPEFDGVLGEADQYSLGVGEHEASRKLTVTPDPSSDDERQRRIENEKFDKMRTRLARPESVKKLDEDLHRMRVMENSFRQKTLQLQQQLGIAPDGMIY